MKTEKNQRAYKIVMLVVLTILITAIVTSIAVYNTVSSSNIKYITVSSDSSSIAKTFEYYKKFIEQKYIGDIDEDKMIESALKGYVEGLDDPYSEYITAEEMQEYMADATGKYVGIGVYIANNTATNQIVVVAPIKGSPAEEAGIQAGDIISKVDGVEYTGEELSEASAKLKAEEGTTVKVEVIRDSETIEFEVERRTIKVNHVESTILENDIGYIQINSFDDGTYDEFKEQYNELAEKNIKSLIIDLRNNGGGIVDESIDIADMMVDKNKTLLITSAKDAEEELTTAKTDKVIDMPIVFLVNENTASASEILTVAVRENSDNVKVVGTQTYGKGVIQSIFTLSNGSGLKLTTNQYYSPNHNTINKVGITPDFEVELPEGESIYTVEQENDTQLQKAIELLK
jgi:carboxyl-terminal processing protease